MDMSEVIKMAESLSENSVKNLRKLTDVFAGDMAGKVAVVSGGASGLGFNIVNRLAEAGCKVVIASRSEERGAKAVDEFTAMGYEVSFCKTDVTVVSDCYAAVDFAVQKYGKIDILVANSATWSMYSFVDMPEDKFDAAIAVDLKGEYFMAQAAARAMIKAKTPGKIVFISSAAHRASDTPRMGLMTHYNAAKGALVSMTKGIAKELHQYGIGVNCVAPGGMLTRGSIFNGGESGALYGPEYLADRSAFGRTVPVAKNPDMVALAVFAMCTSMSDFMVGETVTVDGGSTLSFQEKPWSYTLEGCIPGPKAE